jgi:putative spermidine/putrescine transport system permease protein
MRESRLLPLYSLLAYGFLLSPLLVVFVVSFNADAIVTFPPSGWSFAWYGRALLNRDFLESFVYSAQVAVLTTSINLGIGVPAALAIVRYPTWLTQIAGSLAVAPLTFPQVLIGLALLQYFVATLGFGVTMWVLVLGHVVVTLPFAVSTVSSALYGFNRSYEEAAATLGASPARTLLKVTLPIIRPALITAAVFTFILSFDNVGISLFLTTPGKVPIPIRMYQYVDTHYDPTIAVISTFLIGLAVLSLMVLQRLGTLEQVFKGRS